MKKLREMVLNSKSEYADRAEVGCLVAFKISGVLYTAKIDRIESHHFLCKNRRGLKFKIPKDEIVWFKTGKRWPTSIYRELKGITDGKN